MSDKINLFISHYGGDEKRMGDFKALIENRYIIRDSSLKESEANSATNTEYIKTLIRPLIDWAGTMVVLISEKTAERDWVNWEIEYAMKHKKNIVGVFTRGSSDADIPEGLEEYSSSIVSWNAKSIISAIEGKACFEDSNGNARPMDASGRLIC